jgi:hypothetical protein
VGFSGLLIAAYLVEHCEVKEAIHKRDENVERRR